MIIDGGYRRAEFVGHIIDELLLGFRQFSLSENDEEGIGEKN
jgi:hypothetical protein